MSTFRRVIGLALGLGLLATTLAGCFSFADDVTPPPGWKPTPVPPTPDLSRLYPMQPPDPAQGRIAYQQKCVECHGTHGRGDGPAAEQLPVLPANLVASETLVQAKPSDWFLVISNGRLDKFMPGFRASLDEQTRWDIIAYLYVLGTDDDKRQRGQALYERHCQACHGPQGQGDGPDAPDGLQPFSQPFFAQKSDADIATYLVNDHAPSFSELDGVDRLNVVRYARLLTFARMTAWLPTPTPSPTTAATAIPTATETPATEAAGTTTTPSAVETQATASPEATAEAAAAATETASATPAATLTPASPTPEATPTPEGAITIKGRVIHGGGGQVPPGLVVHLKGFDNFEEVVSLETTVAEDGTFRFDGVEVAPHRVFLAYVEYQGVTYVSDIVTAMPPETQDLELNITIYDTTTDRDALRFDRLHIFVDFLGDRIRVAELYVISNDGDRTVVPEKEGEGVVRYYLPEGATNLQFEPGQGELGKRFLEVPGGFVDTSAIPPGQYQILFAYELPYPNQQAEIRHKVDLPVGSVLVLVPAEGVTVEGEGFQPGDVRDVQGMAVRIYLGPEIEAGGEVAFKVSGFPKETPQGRVEEPSAGWNLPQGKDLWLLVGLAALGLGLVVSGVWLYFRSDEEEEKAETGGATPSEASTARAATEPELDETAIPEGLRNDPEALLDAILALDELHREGKLPTEAYEKRRALYKAHLARLLARGKDQQGKA
ncbi:MAG: c-type cytochrome [Chloroflexi bacterium]|nr:c-type cytochrome [Chloroflexota bacterium]